MTLDPATLARLAACYTAIPQGNMKPVEIAILAAWASGTSPYPCGVPSNTIQIIGAGEPDANLTYIQSADPNVWLPAGGDTTGWHISGNYLSNGETTWYQATLFPCAWALMGSEGGPAPSGMYGAPTPPPAFSYEPTNASIGWVDDTGFHVAPDLATFYLNAHIPLVYSVEFPGDGTINSITNLSSLPSLANLVCSFQNLTSLDCTGMVSLQSLDCSYNSIATLTLTGCSTIVSLKCSTNRLTSLNISDCAALLYIKCDRNKLTVTSVNTILSNLVTHGQVGGDLVCSVQTPAAPPSVGPPNGIAALATLNAESPPWNVITD